MGAYTWFASHVIFPLHERLKKHGSVARRKELEQSQWWPAAQLQQYQTQRLRAFLTEAAAHVPYYRDLFAQHKLDPRAVSSVADLQAYPFLTKPLIRAHSDQLRSNQAGPLKRFNTGGSTGEPLVFFVGKDRVTHDVASKWRATRWWNVDIGDREMVVWGSPVELGAQDRVRAVRDKLLRTRLLPAFEMSEANLDRFVEQIRAFKPAMLFGYPSSLSLIALHARKRGVAMNTLGVRVVFVTSEKLYPHQRETIEQVFGCRVANGYGGRDAGFIAHECSAGKMHLSAEDILVEIVDPQGRVLPAGESGEIVVTHMATGDFPFIRYRTGDVGVLDTAPCTCGRGLPVLKEVQGRSTDFVIATDGTVMHGLALIYVVRELPGIERFKIIQETQHKTRVQLVPGAGFDPTLQAKIAHGMRARLGQDADVSVELVQEIAPERSGKYRYVVSHVQQAQTARSGGTAP